MIQTIGKGARGYLIKDFQRALQNAIGRPLIGGIDSRYGDDVMRGVIEWANAQDETTKREMQRQRALFGEAGPVVWQSLGLAWPDAFARCLLLTASFEGTGFTGSCGPKQTGDTAGVTYGIIGFTSYNGELQSLLMTLRHTHTDVVDRIGNKTLGEAQYKQMLQEALGGDNKAYEKWALQGGSVRKSVQNFLAALGETVAMKSLQMSRAANHYGKIAKQQCAVLFGGSESGAASDRALALMFDVAVQNGGLKAQEISDLLTMFDKMSMTATESDKMHCINTRLIERLRNNKRPTNIIEDVRSRKNTIASGAGTVHGEVVQVKRYGL